MAKDRYNATHPIKGEKQICVKTKNKKVKFSDGSTVPPPPDTKKVG